MLAIRMQRTGRKGHAQFRIIVQESRRTPTSGAIVIQLGHYNPHAKTVVLDKEKTSFYLDHGAQPSDSVVRLLQKESVKLPSWVKLATTKSRTTRHPEKLRKNQPAKPVEPIAEVTPETPDTTAEDTTVVTAEPAVDAVETETSAVEETAATPETDAPEPVAEDTPADPVAEELVEPAAESSAEPDQQDAEDVEATEVDSKTDDTPVKNKL